MDSVTIINSLDIKTGLFSTVGAKITSVRNVNQRSFTINILLQWVGSLYWNLRITLQICTVFIKF